MQHTGRAGMRASGVGGVFAVVIALVLAVQARPVRAGEAAFLPLDCHADQAGGFHDHPDDDEGYVPVLFHPVAFHLEENRVFMLNLGDRTDVDLFITMTSLGEDGPQTSELECRQVRGLDGTPGYSCVNIPPSEMLLINRGTLRFTRTAVGGWTFAGGSAPGGESIYVEYGTCRSASAPDSAG
jgi:hypothetical protein